MIGERVGISEVSVDGRVTGVVHTAGFEETDLIVDLEVGDNVFKFKPSEIVDLKGLPPED